MDITSIIKSIGNFYIDGFRSMKIGRVLWLVIILKLFIMFFILRLFFFPNFIREQAPPGEESLFVAEELTERALE